MKNQRQQLSPKKYTHHIKSGASFAWAFTATMLVASSIAQASDMQIYAVPTAGKKTIVMMLDTSGSMDYTSATSDYNDCNYGYYSETQPYSSSTVYYCTSGPNGTGNKRYGRIYRLQEGMFAFLNSNNSTLANVRVGLGQYSVNGSGNAGKILVPAAELGADINSSQRNALRAAVKELTAVGGTPTAAAYAEAAAYLMGTSTLSSSTVSIPMYFRYYPTISTQTYFYRRTGNQSNRRYYQCRNDGAGVTSTSDCTSTNEITNYTTIYNITNTYYDDGGSNPRYYFRDVDTTSTTPNYQSCTAYNASGCTAWSGASTTNPTTSAYSSSCTVSGSTGTCVNEDKTFLNSNTYSGFSASVSTSKKTDLLSYQSPLPAVADRVSCDGQGVYVLSDGEANSMPDATTPRDIMRAALGSTGFTCPTSGGLTNLYYGRSGESAWHCMGELATKLFNGGVIQTNTANATNPVNVPIQTAFVGFGSDFNAITEPHVQQACKLSSRTQADRRGDDGCSPTGPNTSYRVTAPGYGNGGFFTTQTSQGVTDSVVAFINNLGQAPLAPLTTGGISVPADALSPSGLQPYGYLRALEPNPQGSNLAWVGNLKRYKVLLSGTNAGAFAGVGGSPLVYNSTGGFNAGTQDLWNSNEVYNGKSYNDGGVISLGGAYSRVPMPINGQTEDLNAKVKKYAYAAKPNALRTLFTDVITGSTLAGTSSAGSLLRIPEGPVPTTGVAAYVRTKFNSQSILSDMPILVRQKLLNYLGYNVALDANATALPSPLPIPDAPHLAMGGSIHSLPIQMTYSGTLDAAGNLTDTRSQSILYGTMEGGLHIVDSKTGEEQMVFVPSELLRSSVASKALLKDGTDPTAPQAGLDGAWVADSSYVAKKASSPTDASLVKASRMNIYGGLRMGGSSYYGLDVLDPTAPKFLFRIDQNTTGFSRMGQSWSKPVLANIRYDGAIKRVMIVGGGYDTCYEDPKATLTTGSCGPEAHGNAVYIVDAETGKRLWWASSTGADTNNANMKHSIVSRISAIDRNADGLIDHLYFGDLGGQVFRADLNNAVGTAKADFGKRVVRLANLATDATGAALTGGKNPRFYEAPTVTIHDQGANTFMLVGIAAGNRSTPLDVFPIKGRDGMSPANALTDRLVNNVYGIMDRDFIKKNLFTEAKNDDGTAFALTTEDINLKTLQKDPQKELTGKIPTAFFGASAKNGWYRSLSSDSTGAELADGSFRVKGGLKAFEEPIAITGNLLVPVYDPQGTGIAPQNPCLPRVVGETDRQLYCLPFGVCLNSDGTKNSTNEDHSGFIVEDDGDCPSGKVCPKKNSNVLGAGIVGITPAPIEEKADGSCANFTIAGNEKGTGLWKCIPTINPTRWYERWKK